MKPAACLLAFLVACLPACLVGCEGSARRAEQINQDKRLVEYNWNAQRPATR